MNEHVRIFKNCCEEAMWYMENGETTQAEAILRMAIEQARLEGDKSND